MIASHPQKCTFRSLVSKWGCDLELMPDELAWLACFLLPQSVVSRVLNCRGFAMRSTTNPNDPLNLSEQVRPGMMLAFCSPLLPFRAMLSLCLYYPLAEHAPKHASNPQLALCVQAGTLEKPRICLSAQEGGRQLTAAETAPR